MTRRSKHGLRSSGLAAGLCAGLLALACSDDFAGVDPEARDDALADAMADADSDAAIWTPSERAILESLSLERLGATPASPSNRMADDPRAAELGQHLFFDAGLSANGQIACASCHEPARHFTDGRATSRGMAATTRNAPTLVGVAHSPWLYWDGRRDSLWAQALAPLEAAAEMGTTRMAVVHRVASDETTARLYADAFGDLPAFGDPARFPESAGPFGDVNARAAWNRMTAPDRRRVDHVFANLGKAIAAYERKLQPGPTRFDRYVASLGESPSSTAEPATLSEIELAGLRLFIDAERGLCLRCHNGPLFSNQSFHDVGTAEASSGLPDFGRYLGIQAVLVDPFNCLGPESDAAPEACRELRFLNTTHVDAEVGKFKTPTLRGLSRTGPYLHDGRFETLEQVIEHYRHPPQKTDRPHELIPLAISDAEAAALVAFLETLDAPISASTSAAPGLAHDSEPPVAPSVPESAYAAKSEHGHFDVRVWPEPGRAPLRELHAWIVRVTDENGRSLTPTRILFDASMPGHGHGLDSAPRMTGRRADGDARIDGVRFQMGGLWQLRLQIAADGETDVAKLEVQVGP